MRSKREIRDDLLKALGAVGDEPLKSAGFSRRVGTLIYKRVLRDASQSIIYHYDAFPKYQPDAEFHILPTMSVSMRSVCDMALELVGGSTVLLADAPDVIINQPVEFAAPEKAHVRWFAAGYEQIRDRTFEITNFCSKWVIPLLDELAIPDDLIAAYERNDERIMRQKHWYLFVVSAELLRGKPDNALKILETEFSSPGLRRRYSIAFDVVTERLR